MTSAEVRLSVRNLTISFAGAPKPAVDSISFQLHPGRVTALVGESGSGKSLTAKALIGLLPQNARITHEGFTLHGTHSTRDAPQPGSSDWQLLRGNVIALVPQDALGSLDPLRKIEHEVGDSLRIHRKFNATARRTHVLAALTEAGMPAAEARLPQRADELSGGLRQRALVASALINNPQILIADEPTTALDAHHRNLVARAIANRAAEGAAVLYITHDLESARTIADHVLVMRDGSVCESGPAERVFASPQHPFTRALLAATPAPRQRVHTELSTSVTSAAQSHLGGPTDHESSRTAFASAQPEAALRLENVAAGYGSRPVISNVSFDIMPAQTLGLIGESGSGKTTLLRTILGLHPTRSGTVYLDGTPLTRSRTAQMRALRRRIGYVPQDPAATFPRNHTGAEILADALRAAGVARTHRDARAQALAHEVGLESSLLLRSTSRLSGGERQRLAIARALAGTPAVLLLDEPVSALDLTVQARVLTLLNTIQRARHTAMLLVSHDEAVIAHMSQHTATLRHGEIRIISPATTS